MLFIQENSDRFYLPSPKQKGNKQAILQKTSTMNKKPLYNVFCTTKYGIGCQPVKANNKREARKKFKKRFKKSRVISVEKRDAGGKLYFDAI